MKETLNGHPPIGRRKATEIIGTLFGVHWSLADVTINRLEGAKMLGDGRDEKGRKVLSLLEIYLASLVVRQEITGGTFGNPSITFKRRAPLIEYAQQTRQIINGG